tara:strand:- start:1508 stop:3385 length:1878 start_codon:yes stop_codon:yes gene_type:complete
MSSLNYGSDFSEEVRKKVRYFTLLVVCCFIALGVRVWYLQIIHGQYFRELSKNNRIRMVSLPGYRGLIKDRNGVALVNIRPSFNLYITPEDVRDLSVTLNVLLERVKFDRKELVKKIKEARPHMDVLILSDIERKYVAFIEENKLRLPGVKLKVEPLRNYVFNEMGSQSLGYLGEISKTALSKLKESDYRQGDFIGKDGLEKVYESSLRGEKGFKEVEVDVAGRELRVLRKLPPKSGSHLILTIDHRIQKIVEEMMKGTLEEPRIGSVVVLDVQTGEILAITSKPAYDPNLFSAGISREHWKKLSKDPDHPLQNKSIDGQYPPGSTYKIVTAYAGLEEKVISPDSTIFCPGEFRLGRGRYRCWKKRGHGRVNLHQALVQSCDVYFYTVGHRLGVDRLFKYAKQMGFGNFTGIILSGEKPGLIPSSKWKLRARKEPWQPGETISASIGQGYDLVTPLQQANMMAYVASGGRLMKPQIVKRIEDPDGAVVKEFHPEVLSSEKLNPKSLEVIRKALWGVVHDPHGTGYRARLKNIQVAGKTGTAQVVAMKKGDEQPEEEETPYHFRDHAWFVAFAPYQNPRIAVAVIVEHGGHGGTSAAPVAKKVIQTFFKLNFHKPVLPENSKDNPM